MQSSGIRNVGIGVVDSLPVYAGEIVADGVCLGVVITALLGGWCGF
jgi:hypothetical protein